MSLLGFQPALFDFCPLSSKSIHCLLLMLFDCSGYGENAITSYNLRFYPNRKALKIALFFHSRFPCFPKGLLLHSKTNPFTLQKDSFCNPKRTLLQPKRTPFEKPQDCLFVSGWLSTHLRCLFIILRTLLIQRKRVCQKSNKTGWKPQKHIGGCVKTPWFLKKSQSPDFHKPGLCYV